MRYTLLIALLMPLLANAELLPSLVIEKFEGVEDRFILEEMPEITISENELNVKTEKITVTYPIESIKNYHFSDINAGVNSAMEGNCLQFIGHELIEIIGDEINDVTLRDINGTVILSTEGMGQIDLTRYPSGVYILTVNKSGSTQSFKFLK